MIKFSQIVQASGSNEDHQDNLSFLFVEKDHFDCNSLSRWLIYLKKILKKAQEDSNLKLNVSGQSYYIYLKNDLYNVSKF